MCINDIDKPAAPIPPLHGRAVFEVMRESDRIKMSARGVIVIFVRQQNVAQMAFAEDHNMINAFPPDRPDQPFGMPFCQGERKDVRNRIAA